MAKIATKLNVSLYDNPLTERKDDYVGRIQLSSHTIQQRRAFTERASHVPFRVALTVE